MRYLVGKYPFNRNTVNRQSKRYILSLTNAFGILVCFFSGTEKFEPGNQKVPPSEIETEINCHSALTVDIAE